MIAWLLLSCGLMGPAEIPTAPPTPKGRPWLDAAAPLPREFRCELPDAWSECFVAIPETTLDVGAQAQDPAAPGYDEHAEENEGPVRRVTVPGFRLQRREVSAGEYGRCVAQGWCDAAHVLGGPLGTWGDARRADHPITQVSWEGAVRFCAWLGATLATEDAWEAAARGAEGRRFPWGEAPGCGVATQGAASVEGPQEACESDGTVAGGATRGPTPLGVQGLGGNVWEWTADRYSPRRGEAPPGEARAIRGGGWSSTSAWELRAASRGGVDPGLMLPDVGFRCAR